MTGPGPTEPSAVHRAFAGHLWQMFVALTREGFTEDQALAVIAYVINARQSGEG